MLLVAVGETIAGLMLSALLPLINTYPQIIALYPVMAAARGNIYATLGSRVTSRLHLGVFDAEKPWDITRNELPRVMLQSILSALFSATIAYAALVAAQRHISLIDVYGTALLTPFILAPLLTGFTVYAASLGFRRGLDPDDYLTPLVMLACDLLVLPIVTVSAIIASIAGPLSLTPLASTPLLAARLTPEDRRVLAENMSAILAGSGIELTRSYLLVAYLPFLNKHPYILALLPTFNAENGAALGAIASRASTQLHLGLYSLSIRTIVDDAIRAYASCTPAYLFTSATVALAMDNPQVFTLLASLALTAGIIVIITMVLVTHVLTILGFKRSLDPDNIVIPFVETLTDTLGTFTVLGMALLVTSM